MIWLCIYVPGCKDHSCLQAFVPGCEVSDLLGYVCPGVRLLICFRVHIPGCKVSDLIVDIIPRIWLNDSLIICDFLYLLIGVHPRLSVLWSSRRIISQDLKFLSWMSDTWSGICHIDPPLRITVLDLLILCWAHSPDMMISLYVSFWLWHGTCYWSDYRSAAMSPFFHGVW